MDCTVTLKKLSVCMLKIYQNVDQIINQHDNLAKTNEEDLIGLVEAIENVKLIINKKKEALKWSILQEYQHDSEPIPVKNVDPRANSETNQKIVSDKLNSQTSSVKYRPNNNLNEFGFPDVSPFGNEGLEAQEISRSKMEDKKGDSFTMGIKEKNNQFPHISNYSKAVDKLTDLEMEDNENNLFSEENSKVTTPLGSNQNKQLFDNTSSKHSEAVSANRSIAFLK